MNPEAPKDLTAEAIQHFHKTIETHPKVATIKVPKDHMEALTNEVMRLRRSQGVPIPHQSPMQLIETADMQLSAGIEALLTLHTQTVHTVVVVLNEIERVKAHVGMTTAAPTKQEEAPANGEAKAEDAPAAEAQATTA